VDLVDFASHLLGPLLASVPLQYANETIKDPRLSAREPPELQEETRVERELSKSSSSS
jgi:hypothetical protein